MDAQNSKKNNVMTIYAEVVAMQEDFGGYITYVFKDLNKGPYHVDGYKMATRLPNWNNALISVGDKGYLDYIERQAGIDTWYDKNTGNRIYYAYDGVYINRFIHEKEKIENITL